MEDVGTNHNGAAITETRVCPRDCLMFHSMYSRVGPYRAECKSASLAKLLDRWIRENPRPYVGQHWPG